MKHLGRIISIPIGLVLIAVGIIIFVVVNRTIGNEFKKASVVIPDNGADKIVDPWIRFIGNEGDENNVRVYTFSVYNLTNPVETMAGELPKYEEVGPYQYNYIYERINPILSDDDEILSFKLWKRYYPMNEEGYRNPLTDRIYHFNLAYAAALKTAGGELQLSVALTAAAMGQIITELTSSTVFIVQASAAAAPVVLYQTMESFGNDASFCAAWIAATPVPGTEAFALAAGGQGVGTITSAQCINLFNPANPFSLTNTTMTSYGAYATFPDLVKGALMQGYGLSATDANIVVNYQTVMRGGYVPQTLVSAAPECAVLTPAKCTEQPYIGFLQWSLQKGLLNGMSVADVPGANLAGKPEFGISTGLGLSLAKAQSLFSNASPINLITPDSIGKILTYYKMIATGGPTAVDPTLYAPFTTLEFIQVANYTTIIMDTFVDKGIIRDEIFKDYAGGPIASHTVNDFLFNATDPLLAKIYPNDPTKWVSSPLDNIQSIDVINKTQHTDMIYTGVGDIDLVSAPITFEGEPYLPYKSNISVSGAFAEQLPPNYLFKNPSANVIAFTEEYARALTFTKEIGGNFKGIPYYRYRISESNWEPNEDYYQTIPYLMNLTSVKGGAPAYLSRPRLKGIDVGYYYKAGLTDLINNDEDLDVFADYEPRSGKAIHGRYSLQVNGYVEGADGDLSPLYNKYSKLQSDVVHPMFWGASIIAATQDQVDILVTAYKVDSFRYAITVILIVVGGFLTLIAGPGLFLLDKFVKL